MNQVSKVECVQASMCQITGKKIFTLICEYPRAIHAQLLTHRVFSKNSSSTRAIPITKAIAQMNEKPSQFIFTHNQGGMQGKVVDTSSELYIKAQTAHELGMKSAMALSTYMSELGIHKQNAGRYMEPYQDIRIVLTSTEWENWDWLRMDGAAQGEIENLAEAMYAAREEAVVMFLRDGEWHVPFVTRRRNAEGRLDYFTEDENGNSVQVTKDEAVNISMSACAQTSYRKLDTTLEKSEDMLPKLFGGKKIHASPSEHQATPIPKIEKLTDLSLLPLGVTHVDRYGCPWSGNFEHWIQNRQLIKGHDAAITAKEKAFCDDLPF